jgi:hypothetical protein
MGFDFDNKNRFSKNTEREHIFQVFGQSQHLSVHRSMVHKREPAILPSLLAADLAMLARDANLVAPEKTDYVRAPCSCLSF